MAFSFRRARITGALTATLALTALLGAVPAQAHDALTSSYPADGQTIIANPGKVSITLTNPPNTGIPGSNILTVTGPDGHVVSNGEVTVDGATLSTEADIDHDGKHTVQWRAVSADGHPIEGTFSFTYAPESPASATPSATATAATTAPAAAAEPSAAATQAAADPASQNQSVDGTGWLIGAGLIIAVLAAGLVLLMRRRDKTANRS